MLKNVKIVLVLIFTAFAVPAFADSPSAVNSVVEQLADQGYEVSKISKTFLGRVRILSRKDDLQREVILNPYTGEILRDLVRRRQYGRGDDNSGSGNGGSRGSGSQRSGSDGDSDRDDRSDDNSSDGDDSGSHDGSDDGGSDDGGSDDGGSDDGDDD